MIKFSLSPFLVTAASMATVAALGFTILSVEAADSSKESDPAMSSEGTYDGKSDNKSDAKSDNKSDGALNNSEGKNESAKERRKNKNKESKNLNQEQNREVKKVESSGNAIVAHPTLPGSVMVQADPLAVYKEAGIDQEQERKIRSMAREFEDAQRVRLNLIGNLLKEMRDLQFEPDPDEKKVLAKQDEINRVQSEIGTERVKLVLRIRAIMSFDEKQRLVQNLRMSSRFAKSADVKKNSN